MNKARLDITVSKLVGNNGQLDWLPKNPRQWTAVDVERTKRSIDRDPDFLEDRPLLVVPAESGKGERYIVFAGNLRLKACKDNGVKTAPAVIYFPESDEDRETVKRRAMLDNGSFGSWDYDELANSWDDLPLVDLGIPAWEDQQPDLAAPADAQEDDFDEEKDEIHVVCKPGDIWQLGDHRLMCGDSTDLETVKKLMGGGMADLLLTDPPYNVDYGDETQMVMEKRKHRTDGLIVLNDNMKDDEFLNFLINSFTRAVESMKPGASFYIFHSDTEGYNFRRAVRGVKAMHLSECLIWVKDALCLGRSDYQWRHEPCLYGWKEGAPHKWYSDRTQTTCLEFARPKQSAEHPTMKPIPLFSYLMKNSSKPGDVVLDLFAGSGTTLICAEQLDRKCYTMELDPHYCDVVIARWEKLTGKTAVKI